MFCFRNGRITTTVCVMLFALFMLAACGGKNAVESGHSASPEQRKQVERLNASADEMYRDFMEGNIDKARAKLDELSTQMTEIRFAGIASVEGVGALTDAIIQAKRVFQSVQFSPEQGQAAAAKIRLATDALTHANQPMWLQYYKGMKDSAERLTQAVQARNKKEAAGQLDQLQARYDIIRPSLFISRKPSDVEKMDSLFAFVRGQLAQGDIDPQKMGSGLEHMQTTLDELFQRSDRAVYVPMIEKRAPLTWVLVLGSIIVAVLSFAAWRIFDFERNSFGGGNRHGGM